MAEPGRPTVMTPETIQRLEEGFLMAFSDREACLFASINPSTLYDFCKQNPDFAERKELLKEQVKLRAKQNITGEINKGDRQLSQWWLERRDSDFKPKQESDLKGGINLNVIRFEDAHNPLPVPSEEVPASIPQEPSQV